ncbi:MAG TPA: hypothetical protein VMU47_20535 [Caldimonas sp.]|nr:hypothetical protein [Caldimonas sp.]
MSSLAQSIYLESEPGVRTSLRPAGSTLENPYVYHSVAREFESFAERGVVRIDTIESSKSSVNPLISRLIFTRLR